MSRRAVVVAVVVAALAAACSSGGGPPPDPADVQAARACQTFVEFLNKKATGDQIVEAARPLLAGAADAQANGRPQPRWADLGADLIATAADANTGDTAKLAEDGNKASDACGSIPSAAKVAGGYTR